MIDLVHSLAVCLEKPSDQKLVLAPLTYPTLDSELVVAAAAAAVADNCVASAAVVDAAKEALVAFPFQCHLIVRPEAVPSTHSIALVEPSDAAAAVEILDYD